MISLWSCYLVKLRNADDKALPTITIEVRANVRNADDKDKDDNDDKDDKAWATIRL